MLSGEQPRGLAPGADPGPAPVVIALCLPPAPLQGHSEEASHAGRRCWRGELGILCCSLLNGAASCWPLQPAGCPPPPPRAPLLPQGKTQLVKGKLQSLPEDLQALTLSLNYYTEVAAFQKVGAARWRASQSCRLAARLEAAGWEAGRHPRPCGSRAHALQHAALFPSHWSSFRHPSCAPRSGAGVAAGEEVWHQLRTARCRVCWPCQLLASGGPALPALLS